MANIMATRELQRPDGAIWKTFEQDGVDVLLTARGLEELATNPGIQEKVCDYIRKSMGNIALQEDDGVRTYFGKDSNSVIYTLDQTSYGYSMLMKETNGHSMINAVKRLDRIKEIIDKRRLAGTIPGYINVPDHYGVISGGSLPSQYVLMQGIDTGVNVRDVTDFYSLDAKARTGVDHLIGPITPAIQDEVRLGYKNVEEILNEAIAEETGQAPHLLLSDWHEGNVVLESLKTPIDSSNWAYWVIDQ